MNDQYIQIMPGASTNTSSRSQGLRSCSRRLALKTLRSFIFHPPWRICLRPKTTTPRAKYSAESPAAIAI